MILERQSLGMSVIPGITRLTPAWIGNSARIHGGMGFGLGGLGDTLDPSTMSIADISAAIQQGLMVLNSQQVFQLNLDRLQNGQAPIPTQFAAPAFNIGLAGISNTTLLLGAGLLLLLLLRR